VAINLAFRSGGIQSTLNFKKDNPRMAWQSHGFSECGSTRPSVELRQPSVGTETEELEGSGLRRTPLRATGRSGLFNLRVPLQFFAPSPVDRRIIHGTDAWRKSARRN